MENTRVCKVCKNPKSIEHFPKHSGNNNKYYRHECRECYAGIKKKQKQKSITWLGEFKTKLQCKTCGNNDVRVLEFHHQEQHTKERNLSDVYGWSLNKIEAELAKCDVLCVNCHKKHHIEERNRLNIDYLARVDTAQIYPKGTPNTRVCRVCNKNKAIEQFQTSGTVNGVNYKRHECAYCKSIRQLIRKHEIREWLNQYKNLQRCTRCVVSDSELLEFHHIDSTTKEISVSDAVQRAWSKERIMDELAKCETLCGNCHRIHHHEERVAAKKNLSKHPCAVEKHPI